MCRSPVARTSRSISACRASWSSMWSKKPTPVGVVVPPGAVEVERDRERGLGGRAADFGLAHGGVLARCMTRGLIVRRTRQPRTNRRAPTATCPPAADATKGGSPMFTATLNFALGEDIDALRDLVQSWAQERVAPMAAEIDRTQRCSRPSSGARWASSACSASPCPRSTAAPAWAISRMWSRSRRSRGPRASVALSYGAHSNLCVNQIKLNGTRRAEGAATCRSSSRASTSARSPCPRRGPARTSCR